MDELLVFLSRVADDVRISPAHISLYVALWKRWVDGGSSGPLSFFRKDLVDACKISSGNTFHRALRDLHAFGYLRYVPSYNHFLGSLVYFEGAGK